MALERLVRHTPMVALATVAAVMMFAGPAGWAAPATASQVPAAEAPALLLLAQATAPVGAAAAPAGNATAGHETFLRDCRICHTTDKGGPERFGPNLFGIVGRQAGSEPNFAYSDAFKKTATWKWDPALMGGWISNPGALIPGNAMAVFQGVADKDRDNIIAYLATLK